jgi:phosphoglycolate phosphatase-like HAD superfamily hydrolase
MKMKKLASLVLACTMAVGVAGYSGYGEAASRQELAAISVQKASDFKYWSADSEAHKTLVNYVKDVTNKKSPNYIPVEDRIAVFDLDGTLICETTPSYFEWMMYVHRVLEDPTYNPTSEEKEYAQVVKAAIDARHLPEDMEGKEAVAQAKAFAGMTMPEYEKYVKEFMETPAEGLTNLKRGESFYLPMVEVVSYLRSNDFTVYVVSGSDRPALRILVDGIMDIKPNNIIGTDAAILASNQNGKDGLDYEFAPNDELVRGEFVLKDVKMNKVSNIAREIGKQPVLAFGNSSGDASMFQYTIHNNKYKSAAFSLCCDDLEREIGNEAKAEKMRQTCLKKGWVPVSMKNDFKTIYGDNVKRIK